MYECLPSKCKALSSNYSTTKKKGVNNKKHILCMLVKYERQVISVFHFRTTKVRALSIESVSAV
jgi:hypothetical protein